MEDKINLEKEKVDREIKIYKKWDDPDKEPKGWFETDWNEIFDFYKGIFSSNEIKKILSPTSNLGVFRCFILNIHDAWYTCCPEIDEKHKHFMKIWNSKEE